MRNQPQNHTEKLGSRHGGQERTLGMITTRDRQLMNRWWRQTSTAGVGKAMAQMSASGSVIRAHWWVTRCISMGDRHRLVRTKRTTCGVCIIALCFRVLRSIAFACLYLSILDSNFLSISLADTFQISSPPIKAISGKDAGTPPVANAYLFSSLTGNGDGELYLYGGLFPDKPFVRPSENSVWKYSIKDNSWSEIKQAGFKISDDTEQKYIDRAAEGAGISIPERGLGFYFGGHLDGYTTRGWEQSIPRVYLKSLLELRFPGGTNGDVGEGQVGFRNVSEGSGLDKVGVPERADGVLLFVPWGKEGLLVGIGGGRNDTFVRSPSIVDCK